VEARGAEVVKGKKERRPGALVKPWMRKKAPKTPLPPPLAPEEDGELDTSLLPPQALATTLIGLSPKAEVVEREEVGMMQEEEAKVQEDLFVIDEPVMKPKKSMRKTKSLVSFKDTIDTIPDTFVEEADEDTYSSALDSTITLESSTLADFSSELPVVAVASLLPGLDPPADMAAHLANMARLLEKDKALAALGGQVEERMGEEDSLRRQLAAFDTNNQQMLQVVEEYEKTIQQLLTEKNREKDVGLTNIEKKKEEAEQIKSEIEDVKRASKDLNKKYSRTKEVITTSMANEAALKAEVGEMAARVRQGTERYGVLRGHAEAQLEEANTRLAEVKKCKAAEVAKLTALLRKGEMHVASLEREKEQKERENSELSKICDDLIAKMGQ